MESLEYKSLVETLLTIVYSYYILLVVHLTLQYKSRSHDLHYSLWLFQSSLTNLQVVITLLILFVFQVTLYSFYLNTKLLFYHVTPQ